MGWFNEQIKQRKQLDDLALCEACADVSAALTGKRNAGIHDDAEAAKDAINEILRFYHVPSGELPKEVKGLDAQLEYLMHPHGVMRRTVLLPSGWYKDAAGAMLGRKKSDGRLVALIPGRAYGYSFIDPESGEKIRLSRKTEPLLESEAVCFYRPFPQESLNVRALLKYILSTTTPATIVLFAALTLVITLIGLLLPKINYLLFSDVIESGSLGILLSIACFAASVSISSLLITTVKSLVTTRIDTQMSLSVQAATMARLFSLPADFFKQYSAGELSSKTAYVNSLCSSLVSGIFSTGVTSLFSILYITQIFAYTPVLAVPALIIIGVTLLSTVLITLAESKENEKRMQAAEKRSGITYALISGVQKIKLAGAEKRVFSRWLKLYSKEAKLTYSPPKLLLFAGVISTGISLIGSLVMYWAALNSGVTVAEYYAFNTAYGMVSGAFLSLAGIASTVAAVKPILKEVAPILETVPEVSAGKKMVTHLGGGIELSNVSFRYNASMPLVLDNLSLKIKSGQYLAVVGKTGCGKSTLMRLLLGFETPQRGAVYYDGRDVNALDLKSLRRSIGTVMQNGKLFSGSILDNLTVTAPDATLEDAWAAVETVGMAEDIRRMPMGMQTFISEGSGGISGGQRQRLMIARAIISKPKILMFDEATSALDNMTQRKVSNALDSLQCTRIVIAHRLSTIRHCNRIIVLDGGRIVEDGTYEELIAHNGSFRELVDRQRVDE